MIISLTLLQSADLLASVTYTNNGATKEAGEPGDPNGHSVWYNWTAPANVGVSFETPNFTLGVYTGSAVNTLSPVVSGTGSVTFAALQGTTYRISIDSLSIAGIATLQWKPTRRLLTIISQTHSCSTHHPAVCKDTTLMLQLKPANQAMLESTVHFSLVSVDRLFEWRGYF